MTTYTTADSIQAERLLLQTGVVEKCQHKHKFSDVVELDEHEDFCFVCLEKIEADVKK